MSWIDRLLGKAPAPAALRLATTGGYNREVVGESRYQGALERAARTTERFRDMPKISVSLVPETSNPHDPNAVQVMHEGRTIGYLSREDAAEYRRKIGDSQTACEAILRGGYVGESGVKLMFGAWLNFAKPIRLE